ncbi:ABC transporter permease [Paludifilum halophilum]|uniref:Sugar ABC transporter permease n=1 Tax=Paludifilum halophilum TaxID=1642702 RepID=A0A235B513_9BACL|nr:ABC transporter permease [Paludifilum halophilum]OYD07398.1 sugar ABC transporter permease [Paludifilum halophilum]
MKTEETIAKKQTISHDRDRTGWKEKIPELFSRYGIFLIFLALVALMSVLTPHFFNVYNLINVVKQVSFIGIVAMGVTFVIITKGIDLSSGSLIALVSVIAASFAHPGDYPLFVPLLLGVGVGAFAGLINGTVSAKGMIPPFIATLGMMTAARGLALLYSDGRPIGNLSDSFLFLGSGDLFGIPFPIIVFLFVGLLMHLLLSNTKFGKHTYAIGGNEQAARICGINVDRHLILVYTLAGFLTGISALMLTARISAGQPSMGVMYELDAIAAAVIGGTSLTGGIGTIPGTMIGALIIGVLNNGLDLMNVSSYWQQILKGAIIVTAVLIDSRKNKKA